MNIPPVISGPRVVDVESVLGHSTTLECEVYAVPTAIVEWMKEGVLITSHDRNTNLLSGGRKLQIGL